MDLAAAAMQATSRGRDDALVEWRSAAACARGRFRPDGYGCYRRGPWRFGFARQAYLAQQRYGGMPLTIFLTTTSRIDACFGGAMGG